ncbi:MAG: hypothetical protein JKY25_10700 [Robiginitomaculum sp.]|nr:hypothetical protein [Robiginitomaculum sp.]
MHVWTNTIVSALALVLLSACYTPGSGVPGQNRRPGLGQYVVPVNQRPEPTRRIPDDDLCRSRLFLGLVGQHEGGIVFAVLPGRTRVVKPAEQELDQDEFLQDTRPNPPFVEVREYLSGQVLHAPAIRAVSRVDELGPIMRDRLTVELNAQGYVNRLTCR